MKILYLENHAIFAKQVVTQFLSAHQVTVVPTLALARQIFFAGSFDLLLVDYDLDDGKGDEFVKEIRVRSPQLAMIGVSAHDQGNQALLQSGCNAICGKLAFDGITGVIERVMHGRKPS